MARIDPITSVDQVAPDKRQIVLELIESRGGIQSPFSYLLNSPEVGGRAERLSSYLRRESEAAPLYVRLAALSIARELDCNYIWSVNAPPASSSGISEAAVQAIATRGSIDALPPNEATALRFVRELLRDHRVSDATYAAARELLGEKSLIDLTATMGYYSLLAFTLNAFEVEPAAGAATLPG